MNVSIIPMLEDNFCYYLYGEDIQDGIFVDMAAEFNKIEDFMKAQGIEKVKRIMTTHKHWDHADGNLEAKQRYPDCEIIGGEHDNVKECTYAVKD